MGLRLLLPPCADPPPCSRPQGRSAVALVVALAGCSDDPAEAPQPSPTEQLAAAKVAFDTAKTVQLDLTSRDVPPRENGVTQAKGAGVISATEPKFQGTITGTIKGLAGTIDVIAIGADTYLKFFTPDYKKTDFETLNAPNPAMFFDPATGISALLPQTANPKEDGKTRAGTEVLDKISGTLPGSSIEDLFHLGDGTGTYRRELRPHRRRPAAHRHPHRPVLPRGAGDLRREAHRLRDAR